jgi:tetratricopeptide (TPR) repeat protein
MKTKAHTLKSEIQFPITSTVLLLILILVAINILGPRPLVSPLTPEYETLEYHPTEKQAHITLGRYFLNLKDITEANQELLLTKENPSTGNKVLGTSSDLTSLKEDLANYESRYTIKLKYWQEVVKKNPTYVDGWTQLVYLTYERGNTKIAQEYLNQIFGLDPQTAKNLQESLPLKIGN